MKLFPSIQLGVLKLPFWNRVTWSVVMKSSPAPDCNKTYDRNRKLCVLHLAARKSHTTTTPIPHLMVQLICVLSCCNARYATRLMLDAFHRLRTVTRRLGSTNLLPQWGDRTYWYLLFSYDQWQLLESRSFSVPGNRANQQTNRSVHCILTLSLLIS
jgi:hypothetical protein